MIEAAQNGDKNAFAQLIEKHESRVAATVTGMLGSCSEAEDIGQETFMRFYNSLKNFRGDSAVSTYITRIAINLSLNEIKRRKRKFFHLFSQTDLESLSDEHYNHGDNAENTKLAVRRAIQKLEPKFRSVIVLRLMDGYSTKETAEILNLPTGTVLSRLARAQMKLKDLLSPSRG